MPVIDHWWQTETGWAIAANCLGIEQLPVTPGSPTRPAPGWEAECAVVGAADSLKGQVPVGFLVLKAGVGRPRDEIVAEVVQSVRDRIGPVASFKTATVVERLPKTRSGKILRGTMRRIADGEEYSIPATIEDPAVLEEIHHALGEIGYARAQHAATTSTPS